MAGKNRVFGLRLALLVAGIITPVLLAQQPAKHLNLVIEKLAAGKPFIGFQTGDLSLENAHTLARADIDYVCTVGMIDEAQAGARHWADGCNLQRIAHHPPGTIPSARVNPANLDELVVESALPQRPIRNRLRGIGDHEHLRSFAFGAYRHGALLTTRGSGRRTSAPES